MKRSAASIVSLLIALTVVAVGAPPASAHPYCGIRWGSLEKVDSTGSAAQVVDVRAGRHRCYDRLVVDL